ncbi:uncharacterized protein AKAW2_41201A [Aspergillus luchuensis]|uniref:Lysophospholipase 1 n=2 Tax=Aspergillus kawachii TaxID=1069201 RepID=A0A146EZ28_ASPKA|nr:uncharacterized protein AKAW2_41201A [Aspergillus luchuensis]OJZ84685.1 hypothetical protein ASPFODRAFT_48794 [Aspergillus luchuensis CBS 106.47]BCR99517.1 hypothetical protein AKAW2_41201A [Aspergillus luchuensis]GAT19230.1 lysophospholipase 1 precursor [Aspergillus luchuensis]
MKATPHYCSLHCLLSLLSGLERRAADPLPNEGDRWSLTGYWNPTRVSRTREIGWRDGLNLGKWRCIHEAYTEPQIAPDSSLVICLSSGSFFLLTPYTHAARGKPRGTQAFCSLADRAQKGVF